MTEKDGGFKRQLDAVGKAATVYVPPAKRRQLLLEKQELERRKLKEKEEQHDSAKVEGESDGNRNPSSTGDATTTGENVQTEQEEQLQQMTKQRETWQDQRRVINGTVNRLNSGTIKPLIQELFQKVNLVRLRGPLCKSVLSAAVSSPKYSDVYAAIIAVVNSKLPEVGELMVKRAILAFRRYYKQRDKASCQAVCIYIVHLFHQGVVHELIVLQLLSVLLDGARPTDDSVEIAVHVLQIAGQALLDCSSAGVRACTERMRSLLHEGHLNHRVEYRVEELLKARKNGFKDFPSISEELDLVERDDQITFDTSLDDDDIKKEEELDVFSFDPDFEEHEGEWTAIRAEILGLEDSSDDDTDDSESDDSSDSSDEESTENALTPGENAVTNASDGGSKQIAVVEDLTEADLVHLRRTIYLTIMSSATFEECAHKLARINVPEGRESELINMLIECCSQERTFLRYYGLIASRFCLMDHRWKDAFMESFSEQYSTIHRLETNKLRNVAKLFSHLLHTDSIPWSVMSIIHLNEDETTSSSRIFIKIVIQEMAEAMGIAKLNKRFDTEDEEHKLWYAGMFPKDNVRNTRYAINFFTSIGLGPLTDDLREFLKNAPKLILAKAKEAAMAKKDEDSGDESSSVSSTSSSSFSSSSSSYSTSSYSSYTSSSSYSTSSSVSSDSNSRGRRRGRSSKRGRGKRVSDRGHSSDSSDTSTSKNSRSRGPGKYDNRRRKRERSLSPPKVITNQPSEGDHGRSKSRSRSASSSLSRSRRKDGRRRRSRDRSRSPPKVISSKEGRGIQRSTSGSPERGRGNGSKGSPSDSPRSLSGHSPRRGREKKTRGSPSRSSSRSPFRERDPRGSPRRERRKMRNRSFSRSPRRSSSGSPQRERRKDSHGKSKYNRGSRSPSHNRSKSPPKVITSKKTSLNDIPVDQRSGSKSSSRPQNRSPPRRDRWKDSRNRSRSQSRSLSRGRDRRRKDSGKRSRSRKRYQSDSSSQSSSSGVSGGRARNSRRHRSGGRRDRGYPSSSSRS